MPCCDIIFEQIRRGIEAVITRRSLKTVWRKPHGFESHPLRHTCGGQFAYRRFFIYISLDNFVFTAKIHMRWAIRLPLFFIYISLDNFVFTAKIHMRWAIRLPQFFIYISLDNFVFTAKIHLRFAIFILRFIRR